MFSLLYKHNVNVYPHASVNISENLTRKVTKKPD